MKHVCAFAILSLAVLLTGCARNPQKLDTKDPVVYAKKIKTQVYNTVQTVRRSPRTASEQSAVLLEELEVYSSQPVGEHETTYAQLLQKCQELLAASQKSGGGAEVSRKLNEMKALADKLPGEVQVEQPDE